MQGKRIVVTGLGVLSANGIGRGPFFEALLNGVSGIRPISLFDVSAFKAKAAGEISDFRPEEILGSKGLRTLDRSTKLVNCAVKLALDDGALEVSEGNTRDIGVCVGTTLGSLKSILDFDRDAMEHGPKYVNPALFPNTVINSPASQVSIRFNIKGFNATVSNGFTAGLDAINYASDSIKLGRAKQVLAGGVEELSIYLYLAFYRAKFLAGLVEGAPELSCPFDKRRNGIIFGEGSAILVLEGLESAQSRGAKIYAEVKGFGTVFEPYRVNKYKKNGVGLQQAMRLALERAGLKPQDIDYVCAGANSTPDGDLLEAMAIKEVFGGAAKSVSVSSIKSMLGETFSASGALQAAAVLCALEKQMIPANLNYQEKDAECDLNCVIKEARSQKVSHCLINSFSPSGTNSSLILSKFMA